MDKRLENIKIQITDVNDVVLAELSRRGAFRLNSNAAKSQLLAQSAKIDANILQNGEGEIFNAARLAATNITLTGQIAVYSYSDYLAKRKDLTIACEAGKERKLKVFFIKNGVTTTRILSVYSNAMPLFEHSEVFDTFSLNFYVPRPIFQSTPIISTLPVWGGSGGGKFNVTNDGDRPCPFYVRFVLDSNTTSLVILKIVVGGKEVTFPNMVIYTGDEVVYSTIIGDYGGWILRANGTRENIIKYISDITAIDAKVPVGTNEVTVYYSGGGTQPTIREFVFNAEFLGVY